MISPMSTDTVKSSSDLAGRASTARAFREQAYARGSLRTLAGDPVPIWPVGLTKDRGEALFVMARCERAVRILETGMGLGFSASFLIEAALLNAEANSGTPHVTSVDPGEQSINSNAGVLQLLDAGVATHHTLIEEPSQAVLPRLVSSGERFDLVFVDGDHRFDGAFVDTFYALRLAPAGLVVLDDAWMPSVAKASRFFTSNGLCELVDVFESGRKHRLHALRARSGHADRAWDHFVDF